MYTEVHDRVFFQCSVLGTQNTQQQTQAPTLAAVKRSEFAADNKNLGKRRRKYTQKYMTEYFFNVLY